MRNSGYSQPPFGLVKTQPLPACTVVAPMRTGSRRLEDHVWVAPDESLSHLEQAKWLARHVDPSRIAVRVDSLLGMVEGVRSGIGAGLLLCALADAHAGLVQLAPPPPELDTRIWILTHPELRQVARIRAFTQFLFDALREDPRLARRSE
jgi:DNA-binding transcriptional LysR family regulator